MREPIQIVAYDPTWPQRFAAESEALAGGLAHEAVAIHHVGSTAIPRLPAKPIIDILIEARTYPPSGMFVAALATLGYEAMGESGVPGRHWFRKGRPRTHHVHVTPVDGDVARQMLALRDWLRSHAEDAAEYARLKQRAASAHPDDIDGAAYAALKGPFLQRTLAQALPVHGKR